MGRWWVLPASTAVFWAGVLASGPDHPVEGGGWWAGTADPRGVALGGLLLLAVSAWAGRPRRSEAEALFGAAGLVQEAAEPATRERILLAAGVPPRRDPIPRPPWAPLRTVALLLGMTLLGAGWAAIRAQSRGELGGLEGHFASFGGVAVGDVRRWEYGWSVEAHLERIGPPDETARRTSLRVWISGEARSPPVGAGMPLTGAGGVSAVPAGSGFGDYLRARGVEAIVEVDRLEVLGPPANPAMRLANAVRGGLRRGATSVLPHR
jgi:hypothetical protein